MQRKEVVILNQKELDKPGVYAIKNKRNNKLYIGSTKNLRERFSQHRSMIKNYGGINVLMASDTSGKTIKDFEFIVLKSFEYGNVTEGELREEQEKFINLYDSRNSGYNSIHSARESIRDENKIITQEYKRISVVFPKGTKERIKALGLNINKMINELLPAELDRLEVEANKAESDELSKETPF